MHPPHRSEQADLRERPLAPLCPAARPVAGLAALMAQGPLPQAVQPSASGADAPSAALAAAPGAGPLATPQGVWPAEPQVQFWTGDVGIPDPLAGLNWWVLLAVTLGTTGVAWLHSPSVAPPPMVALLAVANLAGAAQLLLRRRCGGRGSGRSGDRGTGLAVGA